MNCPKCGADNADSALFCGSCGQPLTTSDPVNGQNEKESSASSPKKSKRKKWPIVLTSVLVIAVAIGGITIYKASKAKQNTYNPNSVADTIKQSGDYISFNTGFNDLGYADELATFNSIKALGGFYYMDTVEDYSSNHGKKLFLVTPDSVNNFNTNTISIDFRMPDTFGFSVLDQEAKAGFDKNDAVDLFNSYTRVQLTNYLNELAKNPNYTDIINHEFKEYCGGLSFNSSDKDNVANNTNTLVQSLSSIVKKYGSNVNYEVVEAAVDQPDDAKHTLCIDSLSGKDTSGNVVYQNDFSKLLINVKTYDDNNKCTVTQEKLDTFQMTFTQNSSTKAWAMGKLADVN